MNLVNRFLVEGRTKDGVGASGGVGALLLPMLDLFVRPWALGGSSSFSAGSAKILMQGLRRVVRDAKAIIKDGGLIVMLFFLIRWLTHWV